ncbi:MAG: hypothetical protein ACE15C_09455 [Phycisphaerae bacterium]
MAENPDILGTWSNDVDLYGLSSEEQTPIVFRPDGTGWIAFERWGITCELDTFAWHFETDGRLCVRGDKYDDGDSEGASTFSYEGVVNVRSEKAPSGKIMPIITFDPPFWLQERKWGLISPSPDFLGVPKPTKSDQIKRMLRKKPWWRFW